MVIIAKSILFTKRTFSRGFSLKKVTFSLAGKGFEPHDLRVMSFIAGVLHRLAVTLEALCRKGLRMMVWNSGPFLRLTYHGVVNQKLTLVYPINGNWALEMIKCRDRSWRGLS